MSVMTSVALLDDHSHYWEVSSSWGLYFCDSYASAFNWAGHIEDDGGIVYGIMEVRKDVD